MSLLGWRGPADAVSWIAGDDSCLGDAGALFVHCDAGASDFDDAPADGLAIPVVEGDGVAGAEPVGAVALVSVGVCGCRITLAQVFGQPLLVAEGPAYWSAVAVDVGFLLGAAVAGAQLQHFAGQAFDGLKISALQGGGVAVGLAYAQLLTSPGDRRCVGELQR